MNRVNVPQLRFKGFESDWKEKKIGKVYKINAGGDIDNDRVSFEKTEKFRYPIYANAKKDKGFYGYSDVYKIESGTITVAGRGVYIGIAHARDHQYYPIVRLLVLKPLANEDIYFSENVLNRLNLFVESTGVPQLTAPQFSNYKISLPTLPEQQKIASFLSAVDEKIQQLSRKKELLEQYKKGLMQQLFSGKLRFKDENGNDYADWEEKKLGDIFYVVRGNGISKDKLSKDGTSGCILYGELYTKYKEVIFKVISRTDSTEGVLSSIGDLLIPSSTTTTGIDLANITALNEEKILLGGDITILRTKRDISNVFFAYYLTNYKKFEIAAFAQGSTIVHLSYNHFKVLMINFPSKEEQQKIAAFLSSLDSKIESTNQQITQTQSFKKGLLQQLFV